MSGFAGFAGFEESLWEERYLWGSLGKRCAKRLTHRGPDENSTHVSENCVLSCARLAVSDSLFGKQPLSAVRYEHEYTLVFNGEIYNAPELRRLLEQRGYHFETTGDTEILLNTYIEFGEETPSLLHGMFAFAIDDRRQKRLFLCRDRFGAKPLFYTFSGDRIVFGSEIKALFEYPGVKAILDRRGICELFGLGPERSPGSGVFRDIHELQPGWMGIYDKGGFHRKKYYSLMSHSCEDSYEQAVGKVSTLLHDAVCSQLPKGLPSCSFLSGGLDSSVLTALAAKELEGQGDTLDTYSFAFTDVNNPMADKPWVQMVSDYLGTDHSSLYCSNQTLFYGLYDSVIAKDLPGMADLDSSLLSFCREAKKRHPVAFCGTGADEIFGGYPWFRLPETGTFPWSDSLPLRQSLLKPEITDAADINSYVNKYFQETLWDTPLVSGESQEQQRRRQMDYLHIHWHLPSQLEQIDRMSMYSGLEVRLPYTDHRLVEYLFNTPWAYKCRNGVQKSLLRDGAAGLLPDDILYRKKSPRPINRSRDFEELLKSKLNYILRDSLQPIHKLLCRESVAQLLQETTDYGKPWFGQQMAAPQLFGYLIQVNYWMLRYNVYLEL